MSRPVVAYVPRTRLREKYGLEVAEWCTAKGLSVAWWAQNPVSAREILAGGAAGGVVVARLHHAPDVFPQLLVVAS